MSPKYTDREFGYFLQKFQRRLYRQLIQYETLNMHLKDTIRSETSKVLELLNMDKETLGRIELKDHAEKSCLIGLKAEFELFFYIFCVFILNKILSDAEQHGKLAEEHEGVLRCIQNVKQYYEDFVKGGFRNPKGLFLSKAIPDYGLDRMVRFLTMCGLDMPKILRGIDPAPLQSRFAGVLDYEIRPFSQVRVAFQARHAIEHSFSRAGDSFIYKTAHDWPYSTWKRRFAENGGPQLNERILVDEVDINATTAAMSIVAQTLDATWKKFQQEGLPDLDATLRGNDA